jgi:hypothetical protein
MNSWWLQNPKQDRQFRTYTLLNWHIHSGASKTPSELEVKGEKDNETVQQEVFAKQAWLKSLNKQIATT